MMLTQNYSQLNDNKTLVSKQKTIHKNHGKSKFGFDIKTKCWIFH